jgi:hypothetical protein
MFGIQNPPLLSSNEAHKTVLELPSVPSTLTENDLIEIETLVGRIPRLQNYKIFFIQEKLGDPEVFYISVASVRVTMRRHSGWSVVQIMPAVYDSFK